MKRFIPSIRQWSMLVVICVILSSACLADTILSTVGIPPIPKNCASPTFDVGCVYRDGNSFGSGFYLGQQFTYSQDFKVTYINVVAFSNQNLLPGQVDTVKFAITKDNGSGQPSTQSADIQGFLSGNVANYPSGWSTPPAWTKLDPSAAINLQGGQTYWLVAYDSVSPLDPGRSAWLFAWAGTGNAAIAQNYNAGAGTWSNANPSWYNYAVDIEGTVTPVPEPSAMLLLAVGLLGYAGIRRRCL